MYCLIIFLYILFLENWARPKRWWPPFCFLIHTHISLLCVSLVPLYLLFTRTLDFFFTFNLALSFSFILCVFPKAAPDDCIVATAITHSYVQAMHVLYVQPTYMVIALWTIADMHLYVCRWNCTRLFIVQSPIAKHLFRKRQKRRKTNWINRTLCVESECSYVTVCAFVCACESTWSLKSICSLFLYV